MTSQLEETLFQSIVGVGLPTPLADCRGDDTKFIPGRRFRADFLWREEKLIVEVEGGTWISGRHSRGKGFAKDCEKYNEAAILGYAILRFTTGQVRDGSALSTIEQWFTVHANYLPF